MIDTFFSSDRDQATNEEKIIKQLEEDFDSPVQARQATSGSVIDQIKHDITNRITPNLTPNLGLNNDQFLFSKPFSISKSRSFSIAHEQPKEEEACTCIFLSEYDSSNTSIYVTYFDPQKQFVDGSSIRGLLTFDENNLVFLSEDENSDFNIPLIGHVESALMPHPSNFRSNGSRTLRLLSLTYLPDIKNNTKFSSAYFAADQKILRPFLLQLITKAKTIQNEQKYNPPSLKIINAPEFLSNVQYDFPSNHIVKKTGQKLPYQKKSLPPLPKSSLIPKVKINGGNSSILKDDDFLLIRKVLPIRCQNQEWNLLYKLSDDGCSYITFYKKIEEEEPLIFLLTAESGERIGAFLPGALKQSTHYYGSGESFVFHLDPTFSMYKWSKANQYFVSSTKEEFSIGGGGNSAIWVDGYFNNAFSENCSTFNSPQLTKNSHFTISEVEVWKIGVLKKSHKTVNSISHRY